ncbi:hypothetical protein L917_18964 [Phytophthora nicotianae]|uniref:Uncharacterized protein n=1 Tax=Phytophthora nicotianae TaxID=4792 RepID=W2K813_PHYNI|nr:hypothetical protein L917_18964 [Phytophthora nicotianae]
MSTPSRERLAVLPEAEGAVGRLVLQARDGVNPSPTEAWRSLGKAPTRKSLRSGSFVGEPSGPVLAPSPGLQRAINYFQGHLVLPVSDGFSFVLSQAETENAVGSQTVGLSTAPIWIYGSTPQVTNGMAPLINSATPRVRTAIPSYGGCTIGSQMNPTNPGFNPFFVNSD